MALVLLTTLAAKAGDVAEMRPIGFSPDGRFFAFEQFGEQDGSGFAYAEIQVIDTQTDTYVEGTLVSVLIRREEASIGEARRESHDKAKRILEERMIGDDPGHLVALTPIENWPKHRTSCATRLSRASIFQRVSTASRWRNSTRRGRNSAAAWT